MKLDSNSKRWLACSTRGSVRLAADPASPLTAVASMERQWRNSREVAASRPTVAKAVHWQGHRVRVWVQHKVGQTGMADVAYRTTLCGMRVSVMQSFIMASISLARNYTVDCPQYTLIQI